mgnify:CR=1 FL=1
MEWQSEAFKETLIQFGNIKTNDNKSGVYDLVNYDTEKRVLSGTYLQSKIKKQ